MQTLLLISRINITKLLGYESFGFLDCPYNNK